MPSRASQTTSVVEVGPKIHEMAYVIRKLLQAKELNKYYQIP